MKTPINDGGPAFPVVHAIIPQPGHYTTTPEAQPGMTLRDWFAGMALNATVTHMLLPEYYQDAVKRCYDLADMMIAEKNKQNEP